ncbi:MAG: acyltransferase [Weeksellaceae bacterium]|nr:acyltransferase [Weeksellaceae bacterium]
MKRRIHRILFHSAKFIVGLTVYINGKLYMSLYRFLLKFSGLKINGTPRFIAKSVKFDDFDLITIGDRLVVSSNVIFLTHDYSFTTSLISIGEKPKTDIGMLGPITIGNNVFIGMNSMLLPGTIIEDNVIIGAGSIVRGRIPANSIYSGNPAGFICDIREHAKKMKEKNYLKRIDKK